MRANVLKWLSTCLYDDGTVVLTLGTSKGIIFKEATN